MEEEMFYTTTAKCPYCGFVGKFSVPKRTYNFPRVQLCYAPEGGCDRYYTVVTKVSVSTDTFKITGLNEE